MPNNLLRAARTALLSPSGSGRPMSRQELADACNAVIAKRHAAQGRYRRWAGLTEKAIGALERGEIRWPNRDYRWALCSVLKSDERSLGLYIDRRLGQTAGNDMPESHAHDDACGTSRSVDVQAGTGAEQGLPYSPAEPVHGRIARSKALAAGEFSASSRRDSLVLASDERARELYVRGHGLLHGNHRRDIETAQALLDRAVGRDPRLALAIADRGYTRWRQYFAGWTDRPEAAITGALRDVEAALAVDPDSVAAYGTFVRACWDMGWHERGLQAGRTVHRRHPDSLDAAITYARALMNAGMAELAMPLASSVLQDDPTHPPATKLTIWCELLLRRYEGALEIGLPYLADNRGDANTRWAVALASARLPDGLDRAIHISVEALRADETDITVWLLLGYLRSFRGDHKAARSAWREGADRVEQQRDGMNHRTVAWVANIYAALGDVAAAESCVAYLVENDGANGYIRYRLFHALAELGRVTAAAEMLDSAVTCGFMSLQLLRQEEVLAPRLIRDCASYRQAVDRLKRIVDDARTIHTSHQIIKQSKESTAR